MAMSTESDPAIMKGKQGEGPTGKAVAVKLPKIKKSDESTALARECQFVEKNLRKRLVYGVAYAPFVKDSQGDWIDAEDLEDAAHAFMAQFQTIKTMHEEETSKVKIVESYIAPANFKLGNEMVTKGTWVLVVKVLDDEIWERVITNELTGFSIGGYGARTEEDIPESMNAMRS